MSNATFKTIVINAINAIIGENPVAGSFDKITDTCGSDWESTLKNLRKHKLIFKESEHRPDSLDCHPLIRDHFGEKLKQREIYNQKYLRKVVDSHVSGRNNYAHLLGTIIGLEMWFRNSID